LSNCRFCENQGFDEYETLYGVSVCLSCHEALARHGINKSDEQVSQDERQWLSKWEQQYKVDRMRPYLESKAAIEERVFLFDLLFVLAVLIVFWPISWEAIIPIILIFLGGGAISIKVENRMLSRFHESQMEQEKKDRTERARQKAWLLKRRVEIIEEVNRGGILLWEYYLYEYPPDWDCRASKVKERDGNRCCDCGATSGLHVHHKRAVGIGGTHHLANLESLCSDCHLRRHPKVRETLGRGASSLFS